MYLAFGPIYYNSQNITICCTRDQSAIATLQRVKQVQILCTDQNHLQINQHLFF